MQRKAATIAQLCIEKARLYMARKGGICYKTKSMELEFKPDFEKTRSAWAAFWAGTLDRPIYTAIVPRLGADPAPPPTYGSGWDGDFDPVVEQALRFFATHDFLGDAIPFYYAEFAASHFAALLGCDLRFDADSSGGWTEPSLVNADLDTVEIRFQREGPWWRRTAEFLQVLAERLRGKALIAGPTLVSNLDALAGLRGTQQLLMDLVDRPRAVKRALRQITRAYGEILDDVARILQYDELGAITRHGVYATGRVGVPQCDFSAMISPAMFREFVVPELREEAGRLDVAEYHLDGPGAIDHMGAVLDLDDIDLVQWQPGAGRHDQDWNTLYDAIERAGKRQYRNGPLAVLRGELPKRRQPERVMWEFGWVNGLEAEDVRCFLNRCGDGSDGRRGLRMVNDAM